MSEEQIQEITSPEPQNNAELDSLKNSVEGLERKNLELIRKLKAYKAIPDGVDVQELLDFKQKAVQADLEQQGKYGEARQALEQQFREAAAEKDKRIAELETRVRELELITPAISALADVVHDPDLILKTKLTSDQIAREPDGTVVVIDGYQRTPVNEWAKTLPAWMQKQPKPQGSGAPAGRASGESVAGIKNPFGAESFNLTEQSRLFKTDRDLYERLKTAANR